MTSNPPSFLIESVLNAKFTISNKVQKKRGFSNCVFIVIVLPVVCVGTSTVPVTWDGLGVECDDDSSDLSDPLQKGRVFNNHNNLN
jgi:hypothetical protein